jgi:hypothetical protein
MSTATVSILSLQPFVHLSNRTLATVASHASQTYFWWGNAEVFVLFEDNEDCRSARQLDGQRCPRGSLDLPSSLWHQLMSVDASPGWRASTLKSGLRWTTSSGESVSWWLHLKKGSRRGGGFFWAAAAEVMEDLGFWEKGSNQLDSAGGQVLTAEWWRWSDGCDLLVLVMM